GDHAVDRAGDVVVHLRVGLDDDVRPAHEVGEVQGVVLGSIVLDVHDAGAVRQPRWAALDVGHDTGGDDLGRQARAVGGIRAVGRDHEDGPRLRIAGGVVVGIERDLL